MENTSYKIKKGKYKDYEVEWFNEGQIFTTKGFFLIKMAGDIVKDMVRLDQVLL